MKDKCYLNELKEVIHSQINNNENVLKFKELLFESISSGNLRNEIRFKDIWGDDFNGDFNDNEVTIWLEMNNIRWQWDDYCLGVLNGYFIIYTKDIVLNKIL